MKSLAAINLLAGLTEEEIVHWNSQCYWKEYEAKDQIISLEDLNKDVFFMVKGTVRILYKETDGKEIAFHDVSAGEMFGEVAAIDEGQRSANVVALTPVIVAQMKPKYFQEQLIQYPKIALLIMKRMAANIRTTTTRVVSLSNDSSVKRAYGELISLSESGYITGNESRICPAPKHNEMAARVSVTRETISRLMGDLSKKGIVEKLKNTLIIRDVEKLRALNDEQSSF